MSERTNLPQGWITCTLRGVVDDTVSGGGPTTGDEFLYVDISSINNQTKRIEDAKRLPVAEAPSRARQRLRSNDVVYYRVQSLAFIEEMTGLVQGALYPAVRPRDVLAHHLPLPPLDEQRRIVRKIEELFTELDAGVAALERVRANLKRYRAAVLKAAVEGALTADWRAQHPDVEPAADLLDRILRERRDAWEQAELARYAKFGKTPPKGWQGKYKEPAASDTTKLPELPTGWRWATVEQASRSVRYGTSAKTSADVLGVPVLRMGNIQQGSLDLADLKYLPSNHAEFPELLLELGDLLFNRTNSPELVGKSAVYEGYPEPCSYASYLIAVRLGDGCLPKLLSINLNSFHGRAWIASVVSQQVGQANVNGTKLQAFAFPLPPLAEQEQIVAEVERLLSVADDAEARVAAGLKRATRLRQSILKRAFAGQLVPQDPTDEPVAALLERITAERGHAATTGKAARGAGREAAPRDERVVAGDAGERQLALDLQ